MFLSLLPLICKLGAVTLVSQGVMSCCIPCIETCTNTVPGTQWVLSNRWFLPVPETLAIIC